MLQSRVKHVRKSETQVGDSVAADSANSADSQWELEIKSPFLKRLAWILVALIMVVHLFMAMVVVIGDTGVTVTRADQLGFIGVGFVFSFVALSLLRPRVLVSSEGVEVRNIVNGQFYQWDLLHGLSFPEEAKWARLELPDFEFVPMMAMNIYDRHTIAGSVESFRRLEDRYMPVDD